MDSRFALAAVAAVSSLLLSACGGGGGSPDTSAPPAPTATYRASSGVAEKGPLINGSVVTAQELDATLSPTGRQYSYQITSDLGVFEPTSTFTSQYLGINATGYYFDEVQNAVSSGPVTLSGYNDLTANGVVNVNILTTLASQRIRNLVANSRLTFAQARTQAEREVLSALNIPVGSYAPFGTLDLRGNSEGSHVLAAISALFVNGNNAGQLSVLINNFQNDLGTNGALTNATTVSALAAAARSLNADRVAANLNQRYAALGVTFTPSNISDWIDQDGDGLVGKFKFRVADATPSTIFTLPTTLVDRMVGMSVSASAGQFAVNGTPVTSPVTVHAGDTLTISPNAGSFPNGVLDAYVYSGDSRVARVSFVSGLLAIDVTPATPSIAKGLAQQFTATGTFSDGRSLDLSNSVIWTSSSPEVAPVSTAGVAQSLALGSTKVSRMWSAAGTMLRLRFEHSATLLSNGRVLLVGGYSGGTYGEALTDVEMYDSSSNTWSAAPGLATARFQHTATLLPHDVVLITGGRTVPASLESSELYW